MSTQLADRLQSLPDPWPDSLLTEIREMNLQLDRAIVVLDDDPTGTQTVYDVPVLTEWSIDSLASEFADQTQMFFVLTNSRGLPADQAAEVAREIGGNLQVAAQQTGRRFEIISRSDSTLRGHYPHEVEPLAAAINMAEAPHVIIPFFYEGGRLTIEDEHYVVEQGNLIPASQTPFAHDAVFGFKSSNMKEWVAEKTGGRLKTDAVVSISLDELRSKGPQHVAQKLQAVSSGTAIIVNAVEMRDLEVFTLGALQATSDGNQFLYRTAASFVQAMAGLSPQPLLNAKDLVSKASKTGGLIVVGSHVPKTTAQLACLRTECNELESVELDVSKIIEPSQRRVEMVAATDKVCHALARGNDVVLFTSRQLVEGASNEQNMEISRLVSEAVVDVVTAIDVQPKFLIAKGGITSSDVATKALNVRRAMVIGQLIPGVPVWQLGEGSKFPGMSYIVFPGNVGSEDALLEAYRRVASRE